MAWFMPPQSLQSSEGWLLVRSIIITIFKGRAMREKYRTPWNFSTRRGLKSRLGGYGQDAVYILEINPLLVTVFAIVFSQSVGVFLFCFVFMLFMVFFDVQKLRSLTRPNLFCFYFYCLGKHWYHLCQNVLPMFSSNSCMMSCLFKSLSNF